MNSPAFLFLCHILLSLKLSVNIHLSSHFICFHPVKLWDRGSCLAGAGITWGNYSYHFTLVEYRAGSVEMDLSRAYYFSMVYIVTLCLFFFFFCQCTYQTRQVLKQEEDRDRGIFVFAMCKVDHTRT